jgi:DNA mismatch endonuclease, patch repair protein
MAAGVLERPFYGTSPTASPRRDHLSPEARSRAMAKVHRRDTGPERRLRSALWRAGIRGWRCDVGRLPGRPDIVFPGRRVAVFVDGLLWHGHPSKFPARLNEVWRAKIERNVIRDRDADAELAALGWCVIRVWDADVRRDLAGCVDRIVRALGEPPARRS